MTSLISWSHFLWIVMPFNYVCSIKDLGFHLCDQTIWFITDFINFNIQMQFIVCLSVICIYLMILIFCTVFNKNSNSPLPVFNYILLLVIFFLIKIYWGEFWLTAFRGREKGLRRDSRYFFANESHGTLPEGIQHDFKSSDATSNV